MGEDGVRGHRAEELWVVAVSRGEATAQARRKRAQSSVLLGSELVTSPQLDLRGTIPDSPWVCTHQSHLLLIYWEQVIALTFDVEGDASFPPPHTHPPFPSFLPPSCLSINIRGALTMSQAQGACSLVEETNNEKPNK